MEHRSYDFFETIQLALFDCRKVTNLFNNKNIDEAYKHIQYFDNYNNILLASFYDLGNKGNKPGIVLFCDSFLKFRNKSGFSIDEGIIKYTDISEMDIYLFCLLYTSDAADE